MNPRSSHGRADWAVLKFGYYEKPVAEMHPSLTGLYRVWNEKRGDRPFPSRDSIAARDIKEYLSLAAILRVVEGGRDFEYRLAGETLNHAFGSVLHGKMASEVGGTAAFRDLNEFIDVVFRPVVATGKPLLIEFQFQRPSGAPLTRHALHLPLGDAIVEHILVATSDAEAPLA